MKQHHIESARNFVLSILPRAVVVFEGKQSTKWGKYCRYCIAAWPETEEPGVSWTKQSLGDYLVHDAPSEGVAWLRASEKLGRSRYQRLRDEREALKVTKAK